MRFVPAVFPALLASLLVGSSGAEAAEPEAQLSYLLEIDPDARGVRVTGTVTGVKQAEVTKFDNLGIRRGVKIGIGSDEERVVFNYRVPVEQAAFKDPFQPVLNEEHYAGFLGSVMLSPRIEGAKFENIPLVVEAPEGWKIATSVGTGDEIRKFASLKDLAGTLVCAGDYASYAFELPHRDSDKKTQFHIAIRGERDWDDDTFVDEFKRLARGQMDYFGGSHPAPVQFLALHLLPKGQEPNIPAFNRRAPGHDTVLALHTPSRPREHFEFLGMLAHEHLHNWYPNAMRSDLGPWFMEGLNDYVAYRGLLANKLHTREQFSGMLSKWHREYEFCVKVNNERLMPYRRGMIAAWVFDIELRRATEGRHGLTDVLLRLIEDEPDGGVVQRRHFLAMLKTISGKDMTELYEHLVEDDGAIELAEYLDGTGFRIAEASRAIEIDPQGEAEKALYRAILSE